MVTKKSNAAAEREAAAKAKDSLPERDSYTAKQVATRCGTDAKTLRKFLRSKNSSAEPVGQGGRYEFDAENFPLIQREFIAWRAKAEARKSSPTVVTTPIPKKPKPKGSTPKVNDKGSIQKSIDELHARAKAQYYPPVDPDDEAGIDSDTIADFEYDEDHEPTEMELKTLENEEREIDY